MPIPLTVTFAQVREFDISIATAITAWLGRTPEEDEPIPLSVILDASSNFADICWVLAAIDRPLLIRWAIDCAEAAALVVEPVVAAQEARNPEMVWPRAALRAAAQLRAVVLAGAAPDEIQRLGRRARVAYNTSAAYMVLGSTADAYAAYAAVHVVSAAADASYTDAACGAAASAVTEAISAAADAGIATAPGGIAAALAVTVVARQRMHRWCRSRLRAYLQGADPGPVALPQEGV